MIIWVALVVLFLTWVYVRTRKPNNFPPGPPRLPLVGSFPFMTGSGSKPSLLKGFCEMKEKYGSVVGFYFGSNPAVVLGDYHAIKEAFKSDVLSARPDLYPAEQVRPGYQHMVKNLSGGTPGVIFSHGAYWRELRRFLLRNLRDFGFGKSSMEDMFHEEVGKLCQILEKNAGKPVNLYGTMNISIVNALWAILTGEKLDLEDPNLNKIVTSINELIGSSTPLSPIGAVLPHPAIGKLPPFDRLTGFKFAKSTFKGIADMIEPQVEEHKRTFNPDNIRDFLDMMILEHSKSQDPNSCFAGELGIATIVNALIDMFIAGMETTSSSLVLIILHMLHHPDVKEKVQKEIDEVVGKDRYPSLQDKDNMPYTNAVLLESLRVASLAYLGVPHSAMEDFQLNGYTIPKGTTIMGCLYLAMHDSKLFKDPEDFRPERFINEEGKFVNDEKVIPFGSGKRFCLGQSLAEKEFFIFFTALMHQFDFTPAPGVPLPSYVDIFPSPEILIRAAPPYQVIITKRK